MEEIPQKQIDVPVAEIKAEGQKIDWGDRIAEAGFVRPHKYGDFSDEAKKNTLETLNVKDRYDWKEVQSKISELNSKLVEGEKPWRLPTKDELLMAMEDQFINGNDHGFDEGSYWSGTVVEDHLIGDTPKGEKLWIVSYFIPAPIDNPHYTEADRDSWKKDVKVRAKILDKNDGHGDFLPACSLRLVHDIV